MSSDSSEIGSFAVRFQALFPASCNVYEIIANALKDALPSDLEAEDEEINNAIQIEKKFSKVEHTFVCFFLDLATIPHEEQRKILNDFSSLLSEHVEFCWKFYDEGHLADAQSFFVSMYRMEMNLREAISLICFQAYYPNFRNLIKDFEVSQSVQKQLKKKNIDVLWKQLENEFFLFLFSDYKNLLNIKPLEHEEMLYFLESGDTFDRWRNRMLGRGINDAPHKDFILSIKENLEALETARNCIMHHRCMTHEQEINCITHTYEIERKVRDFLAAEYSASMD